MAATKDKNRTGGTPHNALLPRIVFICTVSLLLLFGLVMVYSASSVVGMTEYAEDGGSTYYFTKQLLFVGVGVLVAAALAMLPRETWNHWTAWLFWVVVVFLLVLTLVLGYTGLGAKRWFSIMGVTFQPSELAKIAIMLVCVFLFAEYQEHGTSKNWFLRLFVAVGGPVLLIMLQPDLGTVIFALAGTVFMIWLGGLPGRWFWGCMAVLVVLGLLAVTVVDFRMERITSFLDPWGDELGSGYQVINSFLAFGDGGLTGVGLGNSHQKYYYLPEVQNDFIFAIIGEELGLLGALAVVVLFATLVFSGFFIARAAVDNTGRMTAGTASMLIGIQAFYNMLCVLGWAPITGKPLPFISAGGTSMLSTMILVGLILWVSFRSTEAQKYGSRRDKMVIHEGGRKTVAAFKPGGASVALMPSVSPSRTARRAGASANRTPATVHAFNASYRRGRAG